MSHTDIPKLQSATDTSYVQALIDALGKEADWHENPDNAMEPLREWHHGFVKGIRYAQGLLKQSLALSN